jgi:hypothetical protein
MQVGGAGPAAGVRRRNIGARPPRSARSGETAGRRSAGGGHRHIDDGPGLGPRRRQGLTSHRMQRRPPWREHSGDTMAGAGLLTRDGVVARDVTRGGRLAARGGQGCGSAEAEGAGRCLDLVHLVNLVLFLMNLVSLNM